MPAGLERNDNMFSVREVPWHGLGVVLDKPPTSVDDALKKSGLDWEVIQIPVRYTHPVTGLEVEDPTVRLNVRADTGDVLGRVTTTYQIRQNRESFQFLANLIGSDMAWETALSLHNGRIVVVTVRLPEYIDVGGDTTGIYANVSNNHAGWGATKVKRNAIRIVCQNTHLAQARDGRETLSIPHIGDMQAKLIAARDVLDMSVDFGKQFKEFGDRLATEKFADRKVKGILKKLWDDEEMGISDRKRQNRADSQAYVQWLFKDGPTVGNAPGSAWCLLNAITEYVDYGEETDHDGSKFVRTTEDPSGLKKRATELVLAAA